MTPPLPVELVREVVKHLLSLAPYDDITNYRTTQNVKPPWALFRSLSLASKLYRSIALDVWFSRLYISQADFQRHPDSFWEGTASRVRSVRLPLLPQSNSPIALEIPDID